MSAPTVPISPPEVEEAPADAPEETPQIDLGESTEETVEEVSDTQSEDTPDPVTALQAQIASLTEKIEALQRPAADPEQIRQAERERARMEQEQRQRDQEREQSDREELHDAISATLVSAGIVDVQPEAVRKVAERFINKRYDQIANKEITHVSEALRWVRGYAETGTAPNAISGRAAQYAGQFADDFNAIFGKLKDQAQQTADLSQMKSEDLVKRLSADQIKAIHAHESGRLGAQNRNGTKPLKRPEGGPPSTTDRSWEAVTNRIISNNADAKDKEMWESRFGSKK